MLWNDLFPAPPDGDYGDPTDDLHDWLDQAIEHLVLARAYADALSWLKEAKGPNVLQLRSYVRALANANLARLSELGQRAFFLWGMNIPTPKGYKPEA